MLLAMNSPRDFFEKMVKPSYRDWHEEPLAEHRAKATVGFANDMAERMFHYLELEKDYGRRRGTEKYRDALAEKCPDFGLLRLIANSTKHFQLRQENLAISSAEQTKRDALIWDKLRDTWEDADYTWEEAGDLLVTTLDNGEQRSLISIVNNVMAMWEELLDQNRL